MITRELVEHIKKQLAEGKTREEIRSVLITKGWPEADISGAINMAGAFSPPPPAAAVRPAPAGQPVMTDDDLTDEETARIYGSPPKPPNKKLIFVVLAVVAALLVGGGAFAYIYYFQAPERILGKMMEKSVLVKSESFSGTAEIDLEVKADSQSVKQLPELPFSFGAGVNLGFVVNFEGASSDQDKASYFSFDLTPKGWVGGSEKPFAMEYRGIDKVAYMIIKGLSLPADFQMDLSTLKNQWVRIDLKEIKETLKGFGMTEEDLAELDQAQSVPEIPPEKMLELYRKFKPVQITEKLKAEKIDGQNTYHYKYSVDKQALAKLFQEIEKIEGLEFSSEESLSQGINDYLERIDGEIWIGKKDFLARKTTVNFVAKVDREGVVVSSTAKLTVFSKDFNKPVKVEVPADAKSLEEFIGLVLPKIIGGFGEDCEAKTGEDKDKCYLQSALFSLSSKDCLKVVSLSKRNDCYYGIAKEKGDEAVCAEIKGTGSQGWKDECYRAVAEATGKSALCEKVFGYDWKNYCYAGATREASYCDKIKKASTKEKCKTGLLEAAKI
ncbi:MAG: hypothetical protein Q8N16_02015 [bacterium]|nr:hypothetical protein [bacterium]